MLIDDKKFNVKLDSMATMGRDTTFRQIAMFGEILRKSANPANPIKFAIPELVKLNLTIAKFLL